MATGIPKNGWKGNIKYLTNQGNGLDARLCYDGKRDESKILSTNAADIKLLWQGTDGKNKLYYGDNLPILAHLLTDQAIKGKVKLVYIDPPFSTKSVFQSRSQMDAYQDLLVGSHYLEFLRQRLVFLRELLADDGSIYVHLDDNMVFYVKVVMDEIFGRNNFRNWITRKKCNPKNYTRKAYGNISDYIIFYTKTDNYVWNRPLESWTNDKAEKEYSYVEQSTGRRYKKVPIHAPGIRHGETGQPWRGMSPPPGKHWQFTPATLDEMDTQGEIYWSPNGNPRRKIYLDESEGIQVQDIWLEFKDAHNQMVKISGYPTEKNPNLLKRIIRTSSNVGDLVLDCFSGSGTTLAVSSDLKRNWIGIDNSTEAIVTTLGRFSAGLQRMGDFVKKKGMPIQGKLVEMDESIEKSAIQVKLLETHEPIRDFSLLTSISSENDINPIKDALAKGFGGLQSEATLPSPVSA